MLKLFMIGYVNRVLSFLHSSNGEISICKHLWRYQRYKRKYNINLINMIFMSYGLKDVIKYQLKTFIQKGGLFLGFCNQIRNPLSCLSVLLADN